MENLTNESLAAMAQADIETTLALPVAMAKCETIEEINTIISIQIQIHSKYVDRLYKTLTTDDDNIKQIIKNLENETDKLKQYKDTLSTANEYISAFSTILSLIAKIAPFIP